MISFYIWNQERKPKLIKTGSRMVVTKVWSVKGTVKMLFKSTSLQLANKKVLRYNFYSIIITDNVTIIVSKLLRNKNFFTKQETTNYEMWEVLANAHIWNPIAIPRNILNQYILQLKVISRHASSITIKFVWKMFYGYCFYYWRSFVKLQLPW